VADVARAGVDTSQFFLTGRDPSNQLSWYEAPGRGWVFLGYAGLAAGHCPPERGDL